MTTALRAKQTLFDSGQTIASRQRTVDNGNYNDGEQPIVDNRKLSMLNGCCLNRRRGSLIVFFVFLAIAGTTTRSISSFATMDIELFASKVTSPNNQEPDSASNNPRSLELEMDDARKNNITTNGNGRGRATKRAADPREIVRTKPYNNKSVAYVSYGSFKKGGKERFETTIIASLRTWLHDDVIFYVLNKEWENRFIEACQEPAILEDCKRVIPIFVDCPEGYYGASPCCKMDKGMTLMWENYSHYDWYSYQDDDMYIRTEYMDDFLRGLSPDEPMVLTSTWAQQLGITWGDASSHANCSQHRDYMYPWGQPAVYSRAGFERMSKAFQLGAIAKQCTAFDVTHDVGNPVVHWMMMLPEVRLPSIPSSPPAIWSGHLLGAHGVGKPGAPQNLTDAHAQIGHVKHPQPPYQYKWHRPKGFLQTSTYKLHGNVSKWTTWHTMNVSDCQRPVQLLAS
jgi:hypothetical protein